MISNKSEYPIIDMKATGRNIKGLMDRTGITVKDIKEYLGLAAPQSIYHWLDGRNLPSLDNLYALSALFSIPMDLIVRGSRRNEYHPKTCAFIDRMYIYYLAVKDFNVLL